jgi:hypothetical protein
MLQGALVRPASCSRPLAPAEARVARFASNDVPFGAMGRVPRMRQSPARANRSAASVVARAFRGIDGRLPGAPGPLHLFHGALASLPSAALSVSHGDRRMRGRRALRSFCAPREESPSGSLGI